MSDYSFQETGIDFLKTNRRVILADDMGLGKTRQAIKAVEELKARYILVACPNSLKYNWETEIKKWYPRAPVMVVDGYNMQKKFHQIASYQKGFLIVNYETLRKKASRTDNVAFEFINSQNWHVIIADEAHRLKNTKAQQHKGLNDLAKKSNCLFLLTGTPVMNKGTEIWSYLNMIDDEKYSSFHAFAKEHFYGYHDYRTGTYKYADYPLNPIKLRKEIDPYILRRTKEEVLKDLPELTIQQMWLDMPEEQAKIYKDMEQEMMVELFHRLEEISDKAMEAGRVVTEQVIAQVVIAQIIRLKQIAVAPLLISSLPKHRNYENCCKFQALKDIIEDTNGKKIVIFSQFKQAIYLIEQMAIKEDWSYVKFTGDEKLETRTGNVNKFQNDPGIKLFLATTQAGGEGITLHAADTCILMDKMWTPAANNQAVARLHRIGQKNAVTCLELLTKDSIDWDIENKLDNKNAIIKAMIERASK